MSVLHIILVPPLLSGMGLDMEQRYGYNMTWARGQGSNTQQVEHGDMIYIFHYRKKKNYIHQQLEDTKMGEDTAIHNKNGTQRV